MRKKPNALLIGINYQYNALSTQKHNIKTDIVYVKISQFFSWMNECLTTYKYKLANGCQTNGKLKPNVYIKIKNS